MQNQFFEKNALVFLRSKALDPITHEKLQYSAFSYFRTNIVTLSTAALPVYFSVEAWEEAQLDPVLWRVQT